MTPETESKGRRGGPIVVRLDPDLEPVMPTFMKNQAEVIRSLREAIAAEDYETLETRGHGMKGYGGGYGFDALTEIGGRLESAARARDMGAVRRIFDEFTDYMDRVEVVYDESA